MRKILFSLFKKLYLLLLIYKAKKKKEENKEEGLLLHVNIVFLPSLCELPFWEPNQSSLPLHNRPRPPAPSPSFFLLFPSFLPPLYFFLVKPFRSCHCACCCCSYCPRFRPPELVGWLPEATASLPFAARPPETPLLAGKPPLKPTWSFLLRSDFRWSSGDKRGTKSKLFTCILIFLIQF